jgi:hypothetical protein
MVPVTCLTTSPKETDITYHNLRDQAERRQDVTTVKRSESEQATRPGRPACVRRPPAVFELCAVSLPTIYAAYVSSLRLSVFE